MRNKFPERDLTQRLDGTVNRYDGKPYIFRHIGGQQIDLRYLRDNRSAGVINAYDDKIDISSVPLGYCQTEDNLICYVTRRPLRMYKQGVTAESLNFKYHSRDGRNYRPRLQSAHFEDMINGNYRTVDQYFERINKEPDRDYEQAISREIALRYRADLRMSYVFYKGDDIGVIHAGTRVVKVPSTDKAWIVSALMEGFSWTVE